MKSEILYMLGVIAVGFAVNYTLRALPFILFAGKNRELPSWVTKLGGVISPIIIALLIVYAYSGLAWKTAWPYLAGALTVALQLWRRNALVSIVAGTALYMTLVACCGCTTQRMIVLDARNPAVRYTNHGVYFGNQAVAPADVPEILEDYDIPHDRVIHIQLDPDVKDLRGARELMGRIAHAGYSRFVLVTERHSESFKRPRPKGGVAPARKSPKKIIYKSASHSKSSER